MIEHFSSEVQRQQYRVKPFGGFCLVLHCCGQLLKWEIPQTPESTFIFDKASLVSKMTQIPQGKVEISSVVEKKDLRSQ